MSAFNEEGKAKREAALAQMRERHQRKRAIRKRFLRALPPCPSIAEQDEMIRSLVDCTAEDLIDRLRNEEYRYTLNAVFNYWRLRMQIRVLREQRGWTQEELGRRARLHQSVISNLENIYQPTDLRISTLQRIANAFDVVLTVRFGDWAGLLRDILASVGNPREALRVDSFDTWLATQTNSEAV